MIATIDSWIHVDQQDYLNTVLPSNGTTNWPTGQHEETTTITIPDPRKAGEKVGVVALAVLTFVALIMIGAFAKLLCEGDNTANKTLYPKDSETDGLVDSDP